MNRQQQEDLKLLKQSGRHVNQALILTYIGLVLLTGGGCFLLTQPLFAMPEHFLLIYLISMMIELAVWMVEFFYLSSGQKGSRIVYWVLVVCQFLFGGWVFWQMFSQPDSFLIYLVWCVLILASCFYLCWFGGWLRHSWWASIFFDHVLLLDEEDRGYEERQRKKERNSASLSAPAPQSQTAVPVYGGMQEKPDFSSSDSITPSVRIKPEAKPDLQMDPVVAARMKAEKEQEEKRRISATYPRMAIRLAVVVYGELVIFPLVVHLFSDFFVSMDNTSTFAQSLMFTVCILTAVVWTIPIFFLYLKQPGVKKALQAGLVLQICVILFEAYSLWNYSQNPDIQYATKVFIYFGVLELVRYLLLFFGARPAFQLPEIREVHQRNDDDLQPVDEQVEEDELLDEEELDDDL